MFVKKLQRDNNNEMKFNYHFYRSYDQFIYFQYENPQTILFQTSLLNNLTTIYLQVKINY